MYVVSQYYEGFVDGWDSRRNESLSLSFQERADKPRSDSCRTMLLDLFSSPEQTVGGASAPSGPSRALPVGFSVLRCGAAQLLLGCGRVISELVGRGFSLCVAGKRMIGASPRNTASNTGLANLCLAEACAGKLTSPHSALLPLVVASVVLTLLKGAENLGEASVLSEYTVHVCLKQER